MRDIPPSAGPDGQNLVTTRLHFLQVIRPKLQNIHTNQPICLNKTMVTKRSLFQPEVFWFLAAFTPEMTWTNNLSNQKRLLRFMLLLHCVLCLASSLSPSLCLYLFSFPPSPSSSPLHCLSFSLSHLFLSIPLSFKHALLPAVCPFSFSFFTFSLSPLPSPP